MKKFEVNTCVWCPAMKQVNGYITCSKMDYRDINREDIFILNENNEAMESKTPDWCPLEDY